LNEQEAELHPLLPSGDWIGFYCYNHIANQHKMVVDLHFSQSIITGSGVDDVSPFTWTGTYDIDLFKAEMTKHYATHTVLYKGDIDENGIWGTWEIVYDYSMFPPSIAETLKEAIRGNMTGGFHIWPKKRSRNAIGRVLEEKTESLKLKEVFKDIAV